MPIGERREKQELDFEKKTQNEIARRLTIEKLWKRFNMNNLTESSTHFGEPSAHSSRPNPPSSSTSKPNEQFLQEPTLAFLESHSSHIRLSLSSGIFVLSLPKLQLNSIGDIGQFQHIQICDLSSNFIESIDSLIINCPSLIKLDLHSNRVRADRCWIAFPSSSMAVYL